MKIELEVIAFDLPSCRVAEENGADRIELCANPQEGGTTPSYGMIAQARKMTKIQLFPIIRPRGGDFFYSEEEFISMQEDIQVCREIGCDGVVIGMLEKDGKIDKEKCKKLISCAGSMDVTFHRAFDRTLNLLTALEDVINLGCKRILTSGGYPTVREGSAVLKKLVETAGDRITIMPGSGVRADNIRQLFEETGARAFHSSARKSIPSSMHFQKPEMAESLDHTTLKGEEVLSIRNILDQL